MEISTEKIFAIIGDLYVQLALTRQQVAASEADRVQAMEAGRKNNQCPKEQKKEDATQTE